MIYRLVYFAFLFVSITTFAQKGSSDLVNLPEYPSYKIIVSEFLNQYDEPKLSYPQELNFAKKPDGWHAMIIENGRENKVIKDELFWVRMSDTFLKIAFDKKTGNSALNGEIPDKFNKWNFLYFTQISPYWGYTGWDKDVMDEYGNKNNLSDSTLNALARAYASYAANLLNNNSGYSNPNERFKIPASQPSLTFDQLQIYRTYEHLAIDTYEKLLKLNPKFENFVADIFNVYSNEIMNCFLTLRYYKNDEEAHKELKPGLYDPFFISMAQNYLASCDSNAILLTNGDSDTFPLIYVQETKGFRRDVLVVNISLLGTPKYISHLFDKIGKAESLPVCMNKDVYRKGLKEIVYIIKKDSVPSYSDLRLLLTNMASKDKSVKFKSGDQYFDFFPTSRVFLDIDKKSIVKKHLVSPADNDSIVAQMKWNLGKDKEYLTTSELVILDMLACSEFNRPIYYAITVEDINYLGLQKFFQSEGLAYKVIPVKANPLEGFTGRINTIIQFDILMKKFTFENINDNSFRYSTAHSKMVTNYRIQYAQLAEALIQKKVNDYALKVLDYCIELFPSKQSSHNYFSIKLVEGYYQLGENSKANSIVKEMVETYVSEINLLSSQHHVDNNEYKLSLYILAELSRLTNETYPQGKFGKGIQKKYSEIYRNQKVKID